MIDLKHFDWAGLLHICRYFHHKAGSHYFSVPYFPAAGKADQASVSEIRDNKTTYPQAVLILCEASRLNAYRYILIFVFIVMILDLFHYNPSALIAGAGVVGLAVGFGAQGLVSDIVTGFFILLEKQIDVGDYITVAGYSGIVSRSVSVRRKSGALTARFTIFPTGALANVTTIPAERCRRLSILKCRLKKNLDETIQILPNRV